MFSASSSAVMTHFSLSSETDIWAPIRIGLTIGSRGRVASGRWQLPSSLRSSAASQPER